MSDTKPDIGRIVSLIMENPSLIAEISNLAKADGTHADEAKEAVEQPTDGTAVETVAQAAPKEQSEVRRRGRGRTDLLTALKPYVSRERAQALDSMISIVEILDTMKRR